MKYLKNCLVRFSGYSTGLKIVATQCAYCGILFNKRIRRTIDHVTPRSKGGASNITNYVCVCDICNSNKGDMSFEYWCNKDVERNINSYLLSLRGKMIDGINYYQQIKNTLNKSLGRKMFK